MSQVIEEIRVGAITKVPKGTAKKDGSPTKKDYWTVDYYTALEPTNAKRVYYFNGAPAVVSGNIMKGTLVKDASDHWVFTPAAPLGGQSALDVYEAAVKNNAVNTTAPVSPPAPPLTPEQKPNWDAMNDAKAKSIKEAQEIRAKEVAMQHEDMKNLSEQLIANNTELKTQREQMRLLTDSNAQLIAKFDNMLVALGEFVAQVISAKAKKEGK